MKFIGKDKKAFEDLLEKAEKVFESYEIRTFGIFDTTDNEIQFFISDGDYDLQIYVTEHGDIIGSRQNSVGQFKDLLKNLATSSELRELCNDIVKHNFIMNENFGFELFRLTMDE